LPVYSWIQISEEENCVPLTRDDALDSIVIAALYIEAVRKGQPVWFRVTSGSMHPLLRVGEQVRIEPATAEQIQLGEIAAFETGEGLVIHRIVQRVQKSADIRLSEMSDVHLRVGPVDSAALVGRVVAIRQGNKRIDLQRPIAQKCARVTARARYRFYTMRFRNKLAQVVIRKCSRLVARLGSWCTRRFCASSQPNAPTNPVM
jgi:signal peptidase I